MNKLVDKFPDINRNISLFKRTLSSFYTDLKIAHTAWDTRDFLMHSTELSYSLDNILLNFQDTSHIPSEIATLLTEQGVYHKKYNMVINNNKYEIQLYYPCVQEDKSIREINTFFTKCVKKIFIWLHFVQPHIKSNCSNTLDITIFFSNHKKMLGQSSELLSPLHVNSAFTTSCKLNTRICIYRMEEWFKVFIHETFHCLGLDFSSVDNSEVEHMITKYFKVNNEDGIRVYETYCEIWAEILHNIIVSFLKTTTKDKYIVQFSKQINDELSFSLFQTAKILDYNNIHYKDLIDINCKTILFREKTHVLSYYILKTILLYNLSDFEKWCNTNNHTLFRFNTTKKNLKDFVALIVKLSTSKSFIETINRFEIFFSKSKLTDSVRKTMRMTISDN